LVDEHSEGEEAGVGGQAALEASAENRHIDVAATRQNHDPEKWRYLFPLRATIPYIPSTK